jgi:hypothetical protein
MVLGLSLSPGLFGFGFGLGLLGLLGLPCFFRLHDLLDRRRGQHGPGAQGVVAAQHEVVFEGLPAQLRCRVYLRLVRPVGHQWFSRSSVAQAFRGSNAAHTRSATQNTRMLRPKEEEPRSFRLAGQPPTRLGGLAPNSDVGQYS